jgi:hypothetical protein
MLENCLKLQLPGISTEASQFALEAEFFVFVRKPVKVLYIIELGAAKTL